MKLEVTVECSDDSKVKIDNGVAILSREFSACPSSQTVRPNKTQSEMVYGIGSSLFHLLYLQNRTGTTIFLILVSTYS